MSRLIAVRLFDCIGQIEDLFIEEAEATNVRPVKSSKRRRAVKYSAYGVVGVAVAVGMIAGYRKLRSNRAVRSRA